METNNLENIFNAFIPAAGLGTRLYPLTKDKPKALVEVGGKPLLEHLLLKLKRAGVKEVVINVHHFADQIISFLEKHQNFGLDITISDEREQLLDTGGGLKQAIPFFKRDIPILVHNVDVFCDLSLQKLIETHKNTAALATLVVRKRQTARYLQFDNRNQLSGWINIKSGEEKLVRESRELNSYAFSGIQLLSPQIALKITEQGAFSVIDLLLRLAKEEKILAFPDKESTWMDLGKYEQMSDAEKLFSQTRD